MLSSANARRNWFTITSLVSRDFKLKYRRSALGVLWSVLNPLLMMIVLSVVFSTFFKFSIENYPLYVILGNVMFALMADSTSGAMNSIIESSSLIKKIRIEKLIFPLEKVLFQLVNFCISLIAVAAVMIFFQVMPHVSLLALPLLLLYVVLFSAGVGMARVPPVGRRYHRMDVRHAAFLPRRNLARLGGTAYAVQPYVSLR